MRRCPRNGLRGEGSEERKRAARARAEEGRKTTLTLVFVVVAIAIIMVVTSLSSVVIVIVVSSVARLADRLTTPPPPPFPIVDGRGGAWMRTRREEGHVCRSARGRRRGDMRSPLGDTAAARALVKRCTSSPSEMQVSKIWVAAEAKCGWCPEQPKTNMTLTGGSVPMVGRRSMSMMALIMPPSRRAAGRGDWACAMRAGGDGAYVTRGTPDLTTTAT